MPASENIEIVETTNIPARKACLTAGCSCKDARIVSYRRAAFYATVARSSGETADRVVPAEPGWRIPRKPETRLRVRSDGGATH
jgi:hypothetical protein